MMETKNKMKMKRTMKMIQTAKSIIFQRNFYFVGTWETQTKAALIDLSYQLKTQFTKCGKFLLS